MLTLLIFSLVLNSIFAVYQPCSPHGNPAPCDPMADQSGRCACYMCIPQPNLSHRDLSINGVSRQGPYAVVDNPLCPAPTYDITHYKWRAAGGPRPKAAISKRDQEQVPGTRGIMGPDGQMMPPIMVDRWNLLATAQSTLLMLPHQRNPCDTTTETFGICWYQVNPKTTRDAIRTARQQAAIALANRNRHIYEGNGNHQDPNTARRKAISRAQKEYENNYFAEERDRQDVAMFNLFMVSGILIIVAIGAFLCGAIIGGGTGYYVGSYQKKQIQNIV